MGNERCRMAQATAPVLDSTDSEALGYANRIPLTGVKRTAMLRRGNACNVGASNAVLDMRKAQAAAL
jgi:hypothetical protein